MLFDTFFKNISQAVNIAEIERLAGVPAYSLYKHRRFLDGESGGQRLLPKHIPAVMRAILRTFGTVIMGGWRVGLASDGNNFSGNTFVCYSIGNDKYLELNDTEFAEFCQRPS